MCGQFLNYCLFQSLEPELVTTIRARLEEREQAKVRRARKKSMRKSVSEEISRSAPSPQASPEAAEPCLSQAEQSQNVEDEQSTESLLSSEDKTELSNDGKDLSPLVSNLEAALDLKEINEELQLRRRTKSSPGLPHAIAEEEECDVVSPTKTAWKTPEPSSPTTSPIIEAQETPVSSKKKAAGRFAPKGAKFRDASNLLSSSQQGTHFAPWAGIVSSPKSPDSVPLSVILQEQENSAKQMKRKTPPKKEEDGRQQRRRTSGSVSWNEVRDLCFSS
ncbi:hypothetical protein OESDEN_13320 [Oesophagostomum dentatum]|uniref:Uncharacterized protein n=1 Tax=Oesophagostomum dentatum TaxID=61180 RepID=A0A0B1SUM1_OESDE|nr:hypothetical protein OESDEN_13320 [Oesophagostomum dentatum]